MSATFFHIWQENVICALLLRYFFLESKKIYNQGGMGKWSGIVTTYWVVFYRKELMRNVGNAPFLIEPFCGQIKSIDPSIFLDNV